MADPITDRRELVLAAAFAVLEGIDAIAGLKTFRNPEFELEAHDLPAVVQVDGGDDVLEENAGEYLLGQRFAVVVTASGVDGKDVGRKLSAMRANVRKALGADPTFGGLARRVVYAGSADPVTVTDAGAAPYGAMAVHFVADFTEDEADPFAAG